MNYIEKRRIERIPVGEDVEMIFRGNIYQGTILNLSEKGMFIGTKIPFPSQSILLVENDVLKLLVRVTRLTEMNGYYDGIGVELADPHPEYLEYINSLKAPL